jgi:hypothetical protein
MTQALLVFLALFALDFVWAKYTIAMTERAAIKASGFAGVVILLSGAAQIGYTANPWLLIPAFVGAFAGTWCALRFGER